MSRHLVVPAAVYMTGVVRVFSSRVWRLQGRVKHPRAVWVDVVTEEHREISSDDAECVS